MQTIVGAKCIGTQISNIYHQVNEPRDCNTVKRTYHKTDYVFPTNDYPNKLCPLVKLQSLKLCFPTTPNETYFVYELIIILIPSFHTKKRLNKLFPNLHRLKKSSLFSKSN